MSYALRQFAGCVVVAVFVLTAGGALADPAGRYKLVGENPGGAGQYQGTVVVTATGDTFNVVWRIGNSRYTGVGVWAESIFSVAYYGSNLTGVAVYRQTNGGGWNGVWAVKGANRLGKEVWTAN